MHPRKRDDESRYVLSVYMNFKSFYLGLLIAISSLNAIASSKGTVGWVEMGPAYDQKIFIKIVGTNSQNSCVANGNYNYVLDNSNNVNAATVSAILAAKAAKQTVSVSGAGNCDLYSGVETLRWFRVED